ncbi:amidohydrolase family protein [Calidifontibacter sp. DB0510]|uniref:Amidohydrolase family protein n=1 Tax=Metallococcus carri TaxID=1656884 RepID=A0A967B1A9_9MICO|nr:amidohydrolase family protein [Metallococcus carri]NHN55580.1 amidohydrolase family protein [Metallococcus carri]NOP38236.1 amidohydrolase family protein [Calidifontibacter sp. DB2511S]
MFPTSPPQRYAVAPGHLWDDGEFARERAIVVDGEQIDWVGAVTDLPSDLPVYAAADTALLPAFVDAHHHLSQSLGAPFAFGEPSEVFQRVWIPLEGALTEDELATSARHAAWQSQRGGFATVADAGSRSGHDLEVVAEVARAAGLRIVLGLICHDRGPAAQDSATVLAAAERHLARFETDPWVRPSLAVAVPELATDATLKALAGLCEDAGAVLQVHLNEHLASVERSLLSTGRRPLEHLSAAGAVGPWLLAAHATMLTTTERRILADSGAAWSYNPIASMWKGNAVADALALQTAGARTALGTDGTRSDGFRLMEAAESAYRLGYAMAAGDPFAGCGRTWLTAATGGGADAVGVADVTGSIRPGFAADFLLVDVRTPELIPAVDLAWQLVRSGHQHLVRAVVTGGRPRVVDGQPTWARGADLLDEAESASRAVSQRAGLSPRRPV